jgi:hypothetical protein
MPKFNVLSGTWYHIEAPDEATAEKAYDAYWSSGEEPMPEGCTVEEGEVDSHWDEYVYVPNETTIKAMEEEGTPEPPKGWTPAW